MISRDSRRSSSSSILIYEMVRKLPEYDYRDNNLDEKVALMRLVSSDCSMYITDKITVGDSITLVVYAKFNNRIYNRWQFISLDDVVRGVIGNLGIVIDRGYREKRIKNIK